MQQASEGHTVTAAEGRVHGIAMASAGSASAALSGVVRCGHNDRQHPSTAADASVLSAVRVPPQMSVDCNRTGVGLCWRGSSYRYTGSEPDR